MPTWPEAISIGVAGGRGGGGGDAVVGGGASGAAGTSMRSVMAVPAMRPAAAARAIGAEEVLDQLGRRGAGQRLALVGPILEHDEAAGVGAGRVERRELGEFRHRALGIERPESGLEDLHRQRVERGRGGARLAPHGEQALAARGRDKRRSSTARRA